MSYSRWISSDFYTYWMSGKDKEKEDQILMCHTDLVTTYEITYKQAKDYVVDQEALQLDLKLDRTGAEELQFYMKQFMSDVDNAFRTDPDPLSEKKKPQ